jgi:hypothetical protein
MRCVGLPLPEASAAAEAFRERCVVDRVIDPDHMVTGNNLYPGDIDIKFNPGKIRSY